MTLEKFKVAIEKRQPKNICNIEIKKKYYWIENVRNKISNKYLLKANVM